MQVWSLGREDPLEEGMVTHSSILAWRIPWTEEPGGLQSIGSQRVGHDWSNLARTAETCLCWVALRGGLGAEMDFLLGELTALEASPQVGFWGPLPGARVFQGHNPLVMIFCAFSCLGPALCPCPDGLFLFSQGSSTSWPPLTPVPTHHTDPFTNLLTHQGEIWVPFLLRWFGLVLISMADQKDSPHSPRITINRSDQRSKSLL